MKTNKHAQIVRMVELAVLTAIVLVLQITGTAVRLPWGTSVSLVLIPITLGAMILGPLAGAWLGFVFGAVAYIGGGVLGMDPFTLFLFQDAPIMTALICFVKGTLAGYLTGVVYRLVCRLMKTRRFCGLVAAFIAAAVTPIVNTGIFILGCFVISGTITGYMGSVGLGGETVVYFLFIMCAGWNFVFEFLFNIVFAPALERVERIVGKKLKR